MVPRKAALFIALTALPLAAADYKPDLVLVTFDGANGTTFQWQDMNDPVMGGASTSTFAVKDNAGIFNGTCAIVSFLKAPGFAKATTRTGNFADASSCLGGALELRVRSTTASYKGFKAGFTAPGVPSTSLYGGGSFKANFPDLEDTTDWQVVSLPFNTFSYDWSGFTGTCDTQDPNGQQHHCCSDADGGKYCPTAGFLATLTDMEVWAEGVQGDFHLEIDWIGASAAKK